MKTFFLFFIFATITLIACSKKETLSVSTKTSLSRGELKVQKIETIKKAIGFDKVEHKMGEIRSWRLAWDFYQKLPEIYHKKGYTDPKDLHSLKLYLMVMLVEPHRFAVLLNEDAPNTEEALKIIKEAEILLSFSHKGKAIIYRYLQSQGLQSDADAFMERTKHHNGDTSKVENSLKNIILELEKYPPIGETKSKKFQKIKKEYDYKLSTVKKMAGV